MTTVAPLRPFGGGQRLAHVRRLRLLTRVKSRQVVDGAVIERGNQAFHRCIVARSVLVTSNRCREISGILTREARGRGISADTFGPVTSATGGSGGSARSRVAGGRGLRPGRTLQRIIERDVI